jgi:O-antigen/teichoic acid export membrane protein
VLFPVTFAIVTLGHEVLNFWLGGDYAQNSTRVLQYLAIGVFLNCLAQIPFALIQAAGRPDLTAKLHMSELPFYLLGMWWLIRQFGIDGAAVAWTARCLVDTAAVFLIARRLTGSYRFHSWLFGLSTALAIGISGVGLLPLSLSARAGILVLVLVLFSSIGWFGVLSREERNKWRGYAKL